MRPTARQFLIPLAVGAFAVAVAVIAGLGTNSTAADGAISVAAHLISSWSALAYILAAIGIGRLGARLYIGARNPLAIQAALGLGLMLTLSHAIGWAGVLWGLSGRLVAIAPLVAGIALLVHQAASAANAAERGGPPGEGSLSRSTLARWLARGSGVDPLVLIVAPGVALLLVAACQPPGWLWATEFGGYDALSYHLQLPQEWFEAGRITPLRHNVYSYLPGYVEAAFLHMAVATGAPPFPDPGAIGAGLLAFDGQGAVSAQVLHAFTAILAAAISGTLARGLVAGRAETAAPADSERGRLAFVAASGLVLLTPWTVVVGSLAYNEMAALAMFAGAMVAALDRSIPAGRRGALAGLLVACACSAKPTAVLFAGPPVAVALFGSLPAREWARAAIPGALVALAALLPWMVRNWLAGGNPVFPFATGIFGTAHWTVEQASRYAAAHGFDGTLADRLALLILEEPLKPGEPALASTRHRGALHPQYFAFFPLVLAAALSCLRRAGSPPLRPAGLLLVGLLAQVAAWLFATHLQARFLLPLLVPGAALIGIRLAAIAEWRVPIGAVRAVAAVALAAQLAASLVIFSREQQGAPNGSLTAGPGYFSGSLFAVGMRGTDVEDRQRAMQNAPITAYVNLLLGETPAFQFQGTVPGSVYLLGDSTPFYYSVPVLYHTTYDASPLGEAIRNNPLDPEAWTRELRARGVSYVLYAPTEVARLRASGWYDPLVTHDAIDAWLSTYSMRVHDWPGELRILCQLREVPPRPGAPSPPPGAPR